MVEQNITHKKPKRWLGILPYIGIILFIIQSVSNLSGNYNDQWQKEILLLAITNMIGVAGVGAGISHIFFGNKIAQSIGFKSNPFQLEVGFCDLSFGIVGLLAPYYSPDFWWAIILFSSLYRIGCGLGHIRQIIIEKNYAINNTAILIVNFGVPLALMLMYFSYVG